MTQRYWGSVSRRYLLSVELTADDSENLENLITTLPEGPDVSFVEYGYDLRGLEREKMRGTHCDQAHLAPKILDPAGSAEDGDKSRYH